MKPEKIKSQIKEIFGSIPENFSSIDVAIDVDLQMQYFERSAKMKRAFDFNDLHLEINNLYNDSVSIESKKDLLIQIASLDHPEAYRVIENFLQTAEGDLYFWATIALHDSRLQLESSLLDEPKLFISTGLGGKNNLLRFFIVVFSVTDSELNTSQQKIIKNEFEIALKKSGGAIESIEYAGNLAKITLLLPLTADIVNDIHLIIDECNIYGNFLNSTCLITNIKIFSDQEILDFYREKTKDDKNYQM